MKQLVFSLLLIAVMAVSCWEQQWEERLKRGDTGIVTHGDTVVQGQGVKEIPDFVTNSGVSGETLYLEHCTTCHKQPGAKCGLIMYGILDRVPGGNWKYAFIRNEDSLAKAGDAYTQLIQKHSNRRTGSHNFTFLSNEEIDAVLNFCNNLP